MTIVSYNVDQKIKEENPDRAAIEDTVEWVKLVREEMGFQTFEGIQYLNKCLPINQSIRKDPRFGKKVPKTCANPDIVCTITDPSDWFPFNRGQGSYLCASEYLCEMCHRHLKDFGYHRTAVKLLVHLGKKEAKAKVLANDLWYWCEDPLGEAPPDARGNQAGFVSCLNETLCYYCKYRFQTNRKQFFMTPVRGLDYPADYEFFVRNAWVQ